VYFKIRNTLPKSDTFLLGHPIYYSNISRQNRSLEYQAGGNNGTYAVILALKKAIKLKEKCQWFGSLKSVG
jgi:hypothetical protein